MFLLVDKPKGLTSHDVIDRVREVTGEKKVGHAGTLDPNATGLLIVGVGRDSTRMLGGLSKETTKEYVAEVVLGEERDTDDIEGKVITEYIGKEPSGKTVNNTLSKFLGEQEQKPPVYSAIKLKGKKAYQLARKGKIPNLKPRKVTVYNIKLLKYEYPKLAFICLVSSGTYIRSLAKDIGKKLLTGAYLENLRRTKIGKYSVSGAISLENLNSGNWKEKVITIKMT